MRTYEFHNIAEVHIVDGDQIEIITVQDDRLDELRPFSQPISDQQWLVGEISPISKTLRDIEYHKLQRMIEGYVAILKSGQHHSQLTAKV